MEWGKLRCFGPDLSLKRLDTKQLLLFISAMRSNRHPKEINSAIWESIDSELQKKLLNTLNLEKELVNSDEFQFDDSMNLESAELIRDKKENFFIQFKNYLRNPVALGSIGIISLASYFLYLKYFSRRAL